MKPIISTHQLSVGYEQKIIIDGVNIKALKGQLICLLGPNGVGKTTILRTMTGLIAPIKGTVFVDEKEISQIKKDALAKKMAVVLTEKLSLNMMTVFQIASMGRYPHTNFRGKLEDKDYKIIEEALRAVKAEHLSNRFYAQLSDGEKQKVMIARALVQEPEVLVLDEPTSHLDVKHKVEVIQILRQLCQRKGLTVILSLHDIDLAIKSCEKILLIQNGHIVGQGAPEHIIEEGTIQELYDIKGARYSELLGGLEFLYPTCDCKVFVFGGNGTGANIYRALSRSGIGICCGILHKNDIDCYIGQTLGCKLIVEESFSTIGSNTYEMAKLEIERVNIVVDTGFELGEMNAKNLELIQGAIKENKKVLFLGDSKTAELRYQMCSENIIACQSIEEIVKIIEKEGGEGLC